MSRKGSVDKDLPCMSVGHTVALGMWILSSGAPPTFHCTCALRGHGVQKAYPCFTEDTRTFTLHSCSSQGEKSRQRSAVELTKQERYPGIRNLRDSSLGDRDHSGMHRDEYKLKRTNIADSRPFSFFTQIHANDAVLHNRNMLKFLGNACAPALLNMHAGDLHCDMLAWSLSVSMQAGELHPTNEYGATIRIHLKLFPQHCGGLAWIEIILAFGCGAYWPFRYPQSPLQGLASGAWLGVALPHKRKGHACGSQPSPGSIHMDGCKLTQRLGPVFGIQIENRMRTKFVQKGVLYQSRIDSPFMGSPVKAPPHVDTG